MREDLVSEELIKIAKLVESGNKPQGRGFAGEYFVISGNLTRADEAIDSAKGTVDYYTKGRAFDSTSREQKDVLYKADRILSDISKAVRKAHDLNRKFYDIMKEADKLA